MAKDRDGDAYANLPFIGAALAVDATFRFLDDEQADAMSSGSITFMSKKAPGQLRTGQAAQNFREANGCAIPRLLRDAGSFEDRERRRNS
jgi:hypothetical protein